MLHLGHAFSAITAHDLAVNAGGRFLLRIEDIDGVRSKPELADAFCEDLAWLGLTWEEVPAQSKRTDTYTAAAETLRQAGLLYPCVCSRAEIAAAATKTGPEGPIYPGTCKGKVLPENQASVWRLDVEEAINRAGGSTNALQWHDALAGMQNADPLALGDVVLVRKDEPASYHLAATLDDAADGVTLVTRGADLFAATHIHRLLQALLDLPVPRWHHHPLILDEQGRKLAKRRGSQSLADLRRSGLDGHQLGTDLRAGRYTANTDISYPSS